MLLMSGGVPSGAVSCRRATRERRRHRAGRRAPRRSLLARKAMTTPSSATPIPAAAIHPVRLPRSPGRRSAGLAASWGRRSPGRTAPRPTISPPHWAHRASGQNRAAGTAEPATGQRTAGRALDGRAGCHGGHCLQSKKRQDRLVSGCRRRTIQGGTGDGNGSSRARGWNSRLTAVPPWRSNETFFTNAQQNTLVRTTTGL